MNPIRFFHGRARNAWRASLLAGLTCASAVAVTACGASVAAPPPAAPPPAATVTVAPPPAPTTPSAPTAPAASAAAAAALPAYQPSRVLSGGGGSAYLVSPDPVGKISGFYTQVLSKDGWQLVSRHLSSHAAELVGKRQAQEARVQIFSAAHGSTILVASYGAA